MTAYIIRRVLWFIPTLLLVSFGIFALLRLIPGDAAMLMAFRGGGGDVQGLQATDEMMQDLRRHLGLDKPFLLQYVEWIWNIVRYADFGDSYWTGQPVIDEIVQRLPITLELALASAVISLVIAIPTGILSAVARDTWLDYLARLIGLGGLSMPSFWLGTLLILLPALWFGYLPPLGYTAPWDDPWTNFLQFIFPSLALGFLFAASVMRMMRTTMLEVLRQDYIRTARAKGLWEMVVLYRHAMRNALIPVVTIAGIQFSFLLGGAVVIERVFGLPGLGSLLVDAIAQRDYPHVQANVFLLTFGYLLINLLVDLSYAWLDPRIRYR